MNGNLNPLQVRLKACSKKRDEREARRNDFAIRKGELRNKSVMLSRCLTDCEEARTILNTVLLKTQEQAVGFICNVTTRLLQHIFGEDYELQFKASVERNRSALQPFISKDGILCSPREELGGGVLDVAALGIRLAQWAITAEQSAPIFILDEPAKFIDWRRIPLFGEALRGVAQTLGLQIILVSHKQELEAIGEKVYHVSQRNGVSVIDGEE